MLFFKFKIPFVYISVLVVYFLSLLFYHYYYIIIIVSLLLYYIIIISLCSPFDKHYKDYSSDFKWPLVWNVTWTLNFQLKKQDIFLLIQIKFIVYCCESAMPQKWRIMKVFLNTPNFSSISNVKWSMNLKLSTNYQL